MRVVEHNETAANRVLDQAKVADEQEMAEIRRDEQLMKSLGPDRPTSEKADIRLFQISQTLQQPQLHRRGHTASQHLRGGGLAGGNLQIA